MARGSWGALALLLVSCGVTYKSSVPFVGTDSKPAVPEFEPQLWAKSLPSAQARHEFPLIRVNAQLAGLQAGDKVYIGASPRTQGSAVTQDPPQTGWILARQFSQVVSGALPLSSEAILVPDASPLDAGAEYVLALKLVRQQGEQEVELKKVLNLAVFDVDPRVPVIEVTAADGRDPTAPLGLENLNETQQFRVRCSFQVAGTNVEAKAGDVARALYVAFPISSDTEVIGAPRNGQGQYLVDLMADTSALLGSQDRPEYFYAECRTRAGRAAQALLASGVDVTPPQAELTGPTMLARALVSPGSSFLVRASCTGSSEVVLSISTKSGAPISPGHVRWAGGEPAVQVCSEGQTSLSKTLEVDPSVPLTLAQFLVTLTATDRAGNMTRSQGLIELREAIGGTGIETR